MRLFLALAVFALAASPSFAAEPPPPDPSTVLAPTGSGQPSAVFLTPAQFAKFSALVTAENASTAPATKAAAITPDGVLGISWATLAGWLGGLGALLFGIWKSTTGAKVRRLVEDSIAAAWWVAERNGQDYDGVVKASIAMKALYEALAQQGIPLDPKVGALATAKWQAMAAQDGIERPRFAGSVLAPAVQPVPASDLASALAKAAAATTPGSATDLADKAAR